MQRLNNATLPKLSVSAPGYDRAALQAGIVHLGIGAFHRGHQADYTDKLLNRQGGDWGIIGASLRSAGVRDQLQPQDGLYCLVENDGETSNIKVIGAIQSVLVGPEQPSQLIDVLSAPEIKVVTLTITEKGYCHDPASGQINWTHPDILWDLEHYQTAPKSAIGYLVAALEKRQGIDAAVTLLSCDNLSHNGKLLQNVVSAFAQRVRPSLLKWLQAHVTFPCSMVDRIVPAVTDKERQALQARLGLVDEGAVVTEPFSQWVIEDSFAGDKPDWAAVGAMLVDDVAPFEDMKLRLLNGSHSMIAYLGYLAGYDFVHEVMTNEHMTVLIKDYMNLATDTLTVPDGFDIDGYKQQLLHRFSNASLNHRTSQIAQDGSQKIPQRWLASVRTLLSQKQDAALLAFALAGWIRYLQGTRDTLGKPPGEHFEIIDPLSATLTSLVKTEQQTSHSPVKAILGVQSIFGNLLQEQPEWCAQVDDLHQAITAHGVLKTLRQIQPR
ncbi:mannitol dehydrogenase family protein [Aestuariicella hydrocarbonica]|uniref:Mannitol dehydrogenase family protein n=1 Tax=Pseudomaricurvus hydrocarbonicus TaxID=1470433 RepID=A0A9E5MPY9_9GAMM|nr:mannitol dehydrogenase family protein [Aestuariicella hydrocarbonica]NHO68270.1 mannitol dehydrogenase family protein [Aestuariicella hydrocarbonica]